MFKTVLEAKYSVFKKILKLVNLVLKIVIKFPLMASLTKKVGYDLFSLGASNWPSFKSLR